MITFLATPFYAHTLRVVLASRALTARVRVRPYRWLFARNRVRGGTYIFTDHERLAHHELLAAAEACRSLRQSGARVLNNPAEVLIRGELLHRLARLGINGFSACRAALDPQPRSFPVFIRSETDHSRFSDDLIPDQETLEARLRSLVASGVPLRHMLVIEYSAAPSPSGLFRKHSVFRVCERTIACSPVVEDSWQVKYGRAGLGDAASLNAAAEEIDTNPYADRLMPAFAAAHIDYGRADFGFIGDRLSVFEINTNPAVNPPGKHNHPVYEGARQRMIDRIAEAIAAQDSSGPPIRIAWNRPWIRRNKLFAGFVLKQP